MFVRRNPLLSVSRSLARACVVAGLLLGCGSAEVARAQPRSGELVPETVALRHGLHRRWVAQVQLDLSRDRLSHVTLDREVLCIQTKTGLAQVIDAETGGQRWIAQVGKRGAPNSELAANERFVALTSGTNLHVLDVQTGKPVFEKQINGVPYAAPAVSENRVYLPLISGMLVSYSLDKPKDAPWAYQSSGRIVAQPIVTPKSVAWGTSRGFAFICNRDRVDVQYQLQTQGEIVSPMAYRAGIIYVASRDGYAYALSEETGQMIWRFSAGSPLSHEPVVVEDMLFLFPEEGGMFAVSADRGTELWRRPNVKQFLAYRRADPQYPALAPCLYVADRAGRTLILEPSQGGLMDTLPTEMLPIKMTNTLNDRLYLATAMGMIQCFHHPELEQPLWNLPAEPAAATKPKPPGRRSGAAAEPAEGEEGAEPAEESPAEPAEENPFDDAGDEPGAAMEEEEAPTDDVPAEEEPAAEAAVEADPS